MKPQRTQSEIESSLSLARILAHTYRLSGFVTPVRGASERLQNLGKVFLIEWKVLTATNFASKPCLAHSNAEQPDERHGNTGLARNFFQGDSGSPGRWLANLIEERKVGAPGRNLERKRRQLEVESQTKSGGWYFFTTQHKIKLILVGVIEPPGLR